MAALTVVLVFDSFFFGFCDAIMCFYYVTLAAVQLWQPVSHCHLLVCRRGFGLVCGVEQVRHNPEPRTNNPELHLASG